MDDASRNGLDPNVPGLDISKAPAVSAPGTTAALLASLRSAVVLAGSGFPETAPPSSPPNRYRLVGRQGGTERGRFPAGRRTTSFERAKLSRDPENRRVSRTSTAAADGVTGAKRVARTTPAASFVLTRTLRVLATSRENVALSNDSESLDRRVAGDVRGSGRISRAGAVSAHITGAH
jgi:hypothetical protein